ncbi:MAG: hypothetical protein U9N49_02170 [Campylobacterota bacterium]|nr:hypothetical protein [Campylobacterota bacterium]
MLSKSKMIFIGLIALYGLYIVGSIFLPLSTQVDATKAQKDNLKAKDISAYNQKESNLSALAVHSIWGIPEYQPPKPIENNETNSSEDNTSFELRNQNGFYTIIIEKKEFDYLGVAMQGGIPFGIFFDNSTKSKIKIKHYKEGENLHKKVKLHKIKHNTLLLIDTDSYKKIEIPYFLVDEMEFKPKENNESNHS